MSNDLILQLNNASGTTATPVTISQDSSFEDFVAQFQTSCNKLLCIINGKQLHYYDKKADLPPTTLVFDYKRKHKGRTAYYFHDVMDNTYCVFGREAALLFYNRLDEVDPSPSGADNIPTTLTTRNKAIITPVDGRTRLNIVSTRIIKSKCPTEIVILDCGQKHTFPYVNYNIEVSAHEVL